MLKLPPLVGILAYDPPLLILLEEAATLMPDNNAPLPKK